MTRRVRFTPMLRAGVFLAALAVPDPARAAAVPFAPPLPVFTAASIVRDILAADVDGDGDEDLLVAAALEGRIVFLRNTSGGGAAWSPVTVATGFINVVSLAAADVDRDGDLDVVSAAFQDHRISWHENLGGTGGSWTTHPISTATATGPVVVTVVDMDRDGDTDVLAALFDGQAIAWYRNDAGAASWTTHTVVRGLPDVNTVAHADIDRDGDPDVLTVTAAGPMWFESAAGGTTFTPHTAGTIVPPSRIQAADVDRDGDPDIVLSGLGVGLVWNENDGGAGWTAHTVVSGPQVADAVPADVDGDGDIDFWTAHQSPSGGVIWYDNASGAGDVWTARTVATLTTPSAVTLADLDGDGDPEGITADTLGAIVRHPNETLHRGGCFAPPRTLSTFAEPPAGFAVADLDRDGDLDVASSHAVADLLFWHENSANGGAWTPHTLATAIDRPGQLSTADVDGDGDADLFADFRGPAGPTGVLWLENAAAGASFTPRTIATASAIYSMTLTPANVDGDGDMDLLQAGYGGTTTRWFRNDAGNGSSWSSIAIGGDSGVLADVDGDGDFDVPATSWFTSLLGWLENTNGTATSFVAHTIATGLQVEVVHAADLDGDGDADFLDQRLPGDLEWRRNQSAGTSWTTHAIPGAGARPLAVDLDKDGDLDLAWSEGPGQRFGWHENTDGSGLSWQERFLAGFGSQATIETLVAADIDRDGAVDLVANPGSLVWHPNRSGQFALSALDVAPGTAQQGTLVSMLRVLARHLGRPGDGAMELAGFVVRLEEAPGDPLTTAEANLLVESLRVYQDGNPNGVFDPADVLVGSVGTLSLTSGMQAVPFADGDPNVSVTQGQGLRNYFVVVELAADASTQDPNRLRVGLVQLGPLASEVEHAAYDIPLTPACPVDSPSGIVVATIPVELMGFTIE